ncbi:histidine kinase N-terminal 7TM domain-containing diguanylate cyclase [Robertmurraya andreesenii]|uniref:Diguanylate cyclase (GGDEF)-like protein n=1 Tax=Anoxybacillus andreesenii TaxID=1325932 RepID=A0ABT9V5P3_9BACL|nr:histidine kinase N-terminal 7TM domain-containing protein [Robertmurraya andreesenii]MDQ0156266.1 diguanylate cyclase (GGDEF)-like protein [Robertmurraya andreesenii]
MNNDIFIYIVFTSISGVLSVLLGVYAYVKRKDFSSSQLFIWMTFLSAIYIFSHAIELASSTLPEIKLWLKIQYLGLPFIPPCGLLLVMHYVGLERVIHKKTVGFILFIPFLTSIISLTNDFHHLLYRSVYLRPNEPSPLADMLPGPWYIVHGSYTFACLLVGIVLLIWYWKQTKWVYWKQIMTLLLSNLLPMIASFLYLMGLSPMGMDPVPIVMCLTSALYFWAILSSNLFVLAPIARNRVFEGMRDAVLVVDTENRIVDYNASAKRLISQLDSSSIGNNIKTLLDGAFHSLLTPDTLITIKEYEWSTVEEKHYRIYSTPVLKGKDISVGKTIVVHDITEQKQLENRLTELAFTDGLTKIYNRIYFMERSSELLNQAKKKTQPFSLLLFDIDHFKKVNDTYGHNVGDKAICHLVAICNSILESEHIFARFGGEEFIVSLPNFSMEEAENIAEEIRSMLENSPLPLATGQIQITASFGVAEATASMSLDMVINKADQALYAAKNSGRNAIQCANNLVFTN